MRKILFKGKRVDTGEWVEGFPFPSIQGEELNRMTVFEQYQGGTVVNTYKIVSSTLCQYIGLKDRIGVKIFEGDIIKHYTDCQINEYSIDTGKIFWHNPTQRYLRTSSTVQSDCRELSASCEYEVIGNIHDKEE
jgi:YopX protein.|nr:MAG TPA: YopX protein [Caudoviricetes sp.]